jgi:hypothetical protein
MGANRTGFRRNDGVKTSCEAIDKTQLETKQTKTINDGRLVMLTDQTAPPVKIGGDKP